MVRGLALILCAFITCAACPRAGTDSATTATAAPSPEWWMSVKDGALHRGLDEAPFGLYVGGEMDGGRFAPGGDVEGHGPIGEKGEPAFLDLRTGKLVKGSEPRPPPPLLGGAQTPSGFSPATRRVAY